MSKTRSKIDDNQTSPVDEKIENLYKSKSGSRILRSGSSKITCLQFGKKLDRRIDYPGHMFCSHCDNYEDAALLSNRIKRDSQRFCCQADHDNFVNPAKVKIVTEKRKINDRVLHFYDETLDFETPIRTEASINDSSLPISNSTTTTPYYTSHDIDIPGLYDLKQKLIDKIGFMKNQVLESEDKVQNVMRDSETKIENLRKESERKRKHDSEKNKKLGRENSYNKKQCKTYKNKYEKLFKEKNLPKTYDDMSDYVGNFLSTIENFCSDKSRNPEKVAETVVELLWNEKSLDGFLVDSLIRRAKAWLRTNVFSPHRILEAMDNNGGHLSMSAVEILRSIETNGEKNYNDTVLPSSMPIKKACKEMDKYCEKILPYEIGTLKEGGEYAKFKAENVIPLMYKAYGLEEEALLRPIKINVSMDSARISTKLQHTTVGLKMADRMATDPKTGKQLVGIHDNDASTLQSKHHCYPTMFAMQKECKSTYSQIRDMVFEELNEMKSTESTNILHGYKPPSFAMNADMAATWKILEVGHAAKNCKNPCHLCAIHDNDLVVPHGIQCNRWCKQLHQDDETFPCYHTNLLSKENVDGLRQTLEELSEGIENIIPHLDNLKNHSKIEVTEDPRGLVLELSLNNPKSIHFNVHDPNNSPEQVFQFSKNVASSLKLRKLPVNGTLTVRKERLRQKLIEEWYMRTTYDSLKHADKMNTSQFLLMQCVPCILHLEMRVAIKILTTIVNEGLKNAISQKLVYNDIDLKSKSASRKCASQYVSTIHKIMTTQIWGTEERPAFWSVPYYEKEEYIDTLSMDNDETRKVMAKIGLIIDASIIEEDCRASLKMCISNYIEALTILRRKKDLSNNEIYDFQLNVDKFTKEWINLYQREGMTNYIHLLASGHVADFLMHYRNLYEHSQQGWEALNSMLKVFYFRRTSRGGGKGDGSKVRQIARWLARRMIWLTKTSFADVLKYNDQQKQEKEMLESVDNDKDDDDFCHDDEEDMLLEPLQI